MASIARRVAAASLILFAGAAQGDVVTEWNDTYLTLIRLTGGPPGPISRRAPLMNLAMYDAVNSIDRVENFAASFKPYLDTVPVPAAGASREAAAAAAAYTVLSQVFAEDASLLATIQSRYNDQLASIPPGPARANGISHGEAVANQLLLLRLNDGSDPVAAYVPGGNAGDWRPSPDGPDVPGFNPQWGTVMPWGIESGAQFRPTRLTVFNGMSNLLASPEYAEQINGSASVLGVKSLGSRTSVTRTADETEAAWFWANDRNGTFKPPGHLLYITKVVSEDHGLTLSQNARLFGLVSIGLGDAGVAAWDCKYETSVDLWRPIDAIRETQNDGNPLTVADPAWLPLNDFTPPFPAYVSGHATFGAVHAAIMAGYFGTDNVTFTVGTDEFAVNPILGYPADRTRTFTSFSQAAWENAMSRIWLGVHYYWDGLDGNIMGHQVGDFIVSRRLRPVPQGPCPADFTLDTLIDDSDFERFIAQYEIFDCRLSTMPASCESDLNADNYVDDTDFVLFAGAYDRMVCP